MRKLVAVIALLSPMVAMAAKPVEKTFGGWTVSCSNTLTCSVHSSHPDGGNSYGVLLQREAGANGAVWIKFSDGDRVRVDGRAVELPGTSWKLDKEDELFTSRDLAAVLRFVEAVRNGNALTLSTRDGDEEISLQGLTASLLFMDEQQGRLNTPTAFIRRGTRPLSAVPAAPALPVLRAAAPPPDLSAAEARAVKQAARAALAKSRSKDEDCSEGGADSDEADALTADEALVRMTCWRAAYQEGGYVYRVQRRAPYRAVALNLPLPAGKSLDMLTSPEYRPSKAMLTHFGRGRGPADCGESATWIFDGRQFQLQHYASMNDCIGFPPDTWPVLWDSRVAR